MKYQSKTNPQTELLESILEQMQGGNLPWRKAWDAKAGGQCYNAISGKAYRGINQFVLLMKGFIYESSAWLTFKQAKDLGGNVRKGERSTVIFAPVPVKARDENGDKTDDVAFMAFRAVRVFNLDQCENINRADLVTPDLRPMVDNASTMLEMFKLIGARVIHGGGRACYVPSLDQIHMPAIDDFVSAAHYDHVLAHEGVHWTGHKSRLNRIGLQLKGKAIYAYEELVAELGAALICAEYGIDQSEMCTPYYLQSWIKTFNDHPKVFWKAASEASAAVEWVRQQVTMTEVAIAA